MKSSSQNQALRQNIICMGPLPLPHMGPSIATEIILNSTLGQNYQLIHLDTSDPRDLCTLGTIDFQNIFLAFKHYIILVWLILKHRPALVYIPISQTTIGYLRDAGFILISKILGRKVVCHLRGANFGNWYISSGPLTRAFVRIVQKLVDGQIVLGESLRPLFCGLIHEDRIFVVPNGRDFTHNGYYKTEHRLRVLYLANFIRTKGVLETLQAAPEVCAAHSRAEFVFAGNWRDESTKREFHEFLNAHPALPVILKGPVDDEQKAKLLSTVDIFVFPTYYPAEGHPWVIVEALAHGLPVISTDQGCIKESVIDGYNGFIVPKRNPQAIAEKIKLLIADEALRKRMAENARAHYERFFTEEKMVEKFRRCFEAVLQKSKRAGRNAVRQSEENPKF